MLLQALQRPHMKRDYKKEFEKIIYGMECPKDFLCYKSEFKSLCKAKEFEVYESLMCLDGEEARKCLFAVHYAYKYFCQCPLRVFISRKLGR